MESNFNSIINRPNNDAQDNIGISIRNQISLEQLFKENRELDFIINKYNKILEEYQKKYGNELFNEIGKQIYEDDEQNEDIFLKKKLLESVPLIREYEKKSLEKDNYINFLLNEKANLEIDNQKIKEENDKLQNELEKLQNDKDELYKALEERRKQKENKNQFNKTFSKPININNKEDNNQEKEMMGSGDNNFNKENMFNTINYKLLNKENIDYKEKIDYEEEKKIIQAKNKDLENRLIDLQRKLKNELGIKEQLERDINSMQDTINRLEIDKKTLQNEVDQYKEDYDSLEKRKKNELDDYMNEIKEIRADLDNYKNKNNLLEEQKSKYEYENAKLKQEKEILKCDRDNLTKIIEDLNMVAKNATEKEKYIDNVINSYKKKTDEINLEKEKLNIKLRMKENQISKLNADYGNSLKEKINSYEILSNITKNKYEDIIKNKEDEIKELKANILTYKIEKDKYLYDYNLMKHEYDDIYQQFQTENSGYIKKYEEVNNELNKVRSEYIGTIKNLEIKNNNLEQDIKIMKAENNQYKNNEKSFEKQIKDLERKENDLRRENLDLKKEKDIYYKKNTTYLEEINSLKANHNLRMDKDKEEYQNRIIYLENVINEQNNKLSLVEGKALDMVKKQQSITEKYKIELQNTISHYENIINGRIP